MSEIMDRAKERGLHILLQLALDEMQSVVEAVNHQHDTKRSPQKYGTPYGAINGMIKVREDILAQCAMWGIEVSPHRKAASPPPPEVGDETVELVTNAFLYEMADQGLSVTGSGFPIDWARRSMRAALTVLFEKEPK